MIVKQLSGLDASFLYMETPTTFGHVTGLMIFERPSADFDPFAAVYAKYASLVGELEPLRRRLVEVPFGLDHPYWVADGKLDLDFLGDAACPAARSLVLAAPKDSCRLASGVRQRPEFL